MNRASKRQLGNKGKSGSPNPVDQRGAVKFSLQGKPSKSRRGDTGRWNHQGENPVGKIHKGAAKESQEKNSRTH